jgi:hypothetical protein
VAVAVPLVRFWVTSWGLRLETEAEPFEVSVLVAVAEFILYEPRRDGRLIAENVRTREIKGRRETS